MSCERCILGPYHGTPYEETVHPDEDNSDERKENLRVKHAELLNIHPSDTLIYRNNRHIVTPTTSSLPAFIRPISPYYLIPTCDMLLGTHILTPQPIATRITHAVPEQRELNNQSNLSSGTAHPITTQVMRCSTSFIPYSRPCLPCRFQDCIAIGQRGEAC